MRSNASATETTLAIERVSTGIAGLDLVTGGGLPADRLMLVEGGPGTGKTTMALQFLMAGVRNGERVLYVTLSETVNELQGVARSHGWSLDGIQFHQLAPTEASLSPDSDYSILHPAEVELGERTWSVLEEAERTKPTRVVIDSLAELALLARDPLRYRRQILGLKQFFASRSCTVLFLDSGATSTVESIAHGVIQLEQSAPEYGVERRRLRIMKLRGAQYRGGYHDYVIQTGGLRVFPRLVAAEHHADFSADIVPSGLPELDKLLGGGLDRGTSALFVGPAGAGKSILLGCYAAAAAKRGDHAVIYVFEESRGTFLRRSDDLQLDISRHVADGCIELRQLDPAALSPGEFDQLVREAVERDGARVVVVDSLNGYLNAMLLGERAVMVQLHELLSYLSQQGVLTLLSLAQHGLVGDQILAPLDVSYLADSVILLRYFEAAGQLRRAISVVKKRSGAHERTIRELRLGPDIQVGQPLSQFAGVLTTAPAYLGTPTELLDRMENG